MGCPRPAPRLLATILLPPKRCPKSSCPQPHVIVVEGRPAIGRGLEGAGERVDALPTLEVLIWRDAFDDHHATLHAVEGLGGKHDLAPLVAHAHTRAVGNAELGQVLRMHLDPRLTEAG